MAITVPDGWEPVTSVAGPSWDGYGEAVQQAATDMAIGILWALSGRRFGLTTVHLAPHIPIRRPSSYAERSGYRPRRPFQPWADRSCGLADEVRLPGPVHQVLSVTVDGELLPADGWRLDPGGLLVRIGEQGWPVGQNLRQPEWTVLYKRGEPAPPGGNVAAGRYAGELAMVLAGDPRARISGRARDIAKQGVQVALAAPEEMANKGLAGIPQVDSWLRSVNPDRLTRAPGVWSPDSSGHRWLALPPEEPA